MAQLVDEASSEIPEFSISKYHLLAEFRFQLRRFLQFSEAAARLHGVEPQQHQLMLAIKGLPSDAIPTVSALAQRLCLKHHSTVELINRLVQRGFAARRPSGADRRQVLVELTEEGQKRLQALTQMHQEELSDVAPRLVVELEKLLSVVGHGLGQNRSVQQEEFQDVTA